MKEATFFNLNAWAMKAVLVKKATILKQYIGCS
jgi:hypothetical protein